MGSPAILLDGSSALFRVHMAPQPHLASSVHQASSDRWLYLASAYHSLRVQLRPLCGTPFLGQAASGLQCSCWQAVGVCPSCGGFSTTDRVHKPNLTTAKSGGLRLLVRNWSEGSAQNRMSSGPDSDSICLRTLWMSSHFLEQGLHSCSNSCKASKTSGSVFR
jgi:hypothetical protein